MDRTNFCKDDFKSGDIVTLRNGDKLIVTKKDFNDIDENNDNDLCDTTELNTDLRYESIWCGRNITETEDKKNDIMKVERPTQYKIMYKRDEVKEMTLSQVCKELGYKVKIIKEE